ncbi:hypothetical protein HAX54_046537 [Datura stramonium]|uniref:Uncharacterized protein n=1 Tax=Datura stramonium TaxID=4076 RepID=A0ABS8WH67_DATST|nr:hypothetical protein [Datura stramonium]
MRQFNFHNISCIQKGGVANLSAVDAFLKEMLNASRQGKKSESHPGNTPGLRHSTPPAHKIASKVYIIFLHIQDKDGPMIALSFALFCLLFTHLCWHNLTSCSRTLGLLPMNTERLKDMASVHSLCYDYFMRVIYATSHFNANRYRNELQTALQIFPPGGIPSLFCLRC